MFVPYPPGGATDTIARIIQDSMERSLGQSMVLENVGGTGGHDPRRSCCPCRA
jgi:tripartite-type tricarboxylate transporter receptor subunit TctC